MMKGNILEPLVSIVVCAWNEEIHLQTCLRSLLNQNTKFDYEIIIVNDGSTDSTFEIASSFARQKAIRIYSNETNMGIGYSSNVGIKHSHGRYIVRVDADDYVSEFFLQTLFLGFHDNKNYKAVTCDYFTVNADGEFLSSRLFESDPIACGIMFEKQALVNIGLYRKELRVFEEIELMERFKEKYQILHLPIALYRYRIHDRNTSSYARE